MDLTPPNNAVDNRWIWGQIKCNIKYFMKSNNEISV